MADTRQCFQPFETLNIATDGKVYPCCIVDERLVIGNLTSQTLEEIVAGAAAVEMRRRLLSGDIADLPCAVCTNAPLGSIAEFAEKIQKLFAS
jgi:radical SAM protein with 4Fe4S-binding SPASM domain